MLNDHEQRTLREVAAHLADEDAEFARSFATRQRRMGGNQQQFAEYVRFNSGAVHIAVAVLGVAALIVASAGAAWQLVAAAELAWLLWHSTPLPPQQ